MFLSVGCGPEKVFGISRVGLGMKALADTGYVSGPSRRRLELGVLLADWIR